MDVASSPYPATFTAEVADPIDRWRPFVQWLLAIPHWIIVQVLGTVAQVLWIVGSLVILFTGKLPPGIAGFQSLYLRYNNRTFAYAGFFRTEYPPFAFQTVPDDPGEYPGIRTDLVPDLEERNRLTSFFVIRFILAIPHLVVLAFIGIAAFIVWVVAAFAILFTGVWPEGMLRFVVGYMRWSLRVNAYFFLLTDEYPPFSLD